MKAFKIAAAQILSTDGDILANVTRHRRVMAVAAKKDVDVIVFPELSLSGYLPEQSQQLAIAPDDRCLHPLAHASEHMGLTVIAGAPLAVNGKIHIGALIFSPSGEITIYAKMHLHSGEQAFFTAGTRHCVHSMSDCRIGIGICADTTHPGHVRACAASGAIIYAAGVLISHNGYAADTSLLKSYAARHDLLVAMANHNRPTGGWTPAGQSAIWSWEGRLAAADDTQNALVIAERGPQRWRASVLNLDGLDV